MKPVFVNGLGCLEGGARVVLEELARAYPATGPRALFIVPSTFRVEKANVPRPVRVIRLNHRVFGRYLRPLIELAMWTSVKLRRFSHVVNLSHYGWCAGGSYVLYFHNEMLLGSTREQRPFGPGLGSSLKEWWFRSCLANADRIVVQSERVAAAVRSYASTRGIRPPNLAVVIPRIAPKPLPQAARKVFDIQFFYPSSGFAHKRSALAVAGCLQASRRDERVGLVLTESGSASAADAIRYVGTLTPDDVAATYMASDALLFTSSHETLGLPLLEGLSHGLPAVLPALDYARDIYGDAAVYFEDDDPRAVADAVMACVARRDELRVNAMRRWETVRAVSRTWQEHWEILGVTSRGGDGG